jgi:hypothetical protein
MVAGQSEVRNGSGADLSAVRFPALRARKQSFCLRPDQVIRDGLTAPSHMSGYEAEADLALRMIVRPLSALLRHSPV